MQKAPRIARLGEVVLWWCFQERNLMGWKLFQCAVGLLIIVASIEYEWEADGLAVGVLAGMTAWYATGLATALLSLGRRLAGLSAPEPRRKCVGHLDSWAREVGLIDKPVQDGSSVRVQR